MSRRGTFSDETMDDPEENVRTTSRRKYQAPNSSPGRSRNDENRRHRTSSPSRERKTYKNYGHRDEPETHRYDESSHRRYPSKDDTSRGKIVERNWRTRGSSRSRYGDQNEVFSNFRSKRNSDYHPGKSSITKYRDRKSKRSPDRKILRRDTSPSDDSSNRGETNSDCESLSSRSSVGHPSTLDNKRRRNDQRRPLTSNGTVPSKSFESRSGRTYDQNTSNCENNRAHQRNRDKPKYMISDGKKRPNEKKSGVHFVGFKYLKELSEKETPQITCEILNPDSPIHLFLEKKNLQTEWLFLLVKIVAKVSSFEFQDSRNAMLNLICRSQFLYSVSYYLGEVSVELEKSTIAKLPSFITDLTEFYSSVIDFLPTVAVDNDFLKMIMKTMKAVDSMNDDHELCVDENVSLRLKVLKEKVEDHKKMCEGPPKPVQKRNFMLFLSEQPPPDNFRDLDLYPTYEDLTRPSFGFVRPNKIKGAYDNVEHYLDVQFRLIREDFIDPLRQGLKQYLESKSNMGQKRPLYKFQSLRLYPNCVFREVMKTAKNQFAYLLHFDPRNKMRKINWEYSKRFMYGSLLLFTNNDFTTFFYGTVAHRDVKQLSEGNISISFPDDVQTDVNFLSKEFLMAESEVFFEPYFLIMRSLKKLNAENFPMIDYIVGGESRAVPPSYLVQHVQLMWNIHGTAINPLNIGDWPSPLELGLDVHQYQAFQKALTSKFCVIQGPPGTGKTFIGLKIVQVLQKNFTRRPLLIVCYTNHALDQFLEGILQYTRKIIRIGSQSRSELLKDFHLRGQNQLSIRNCLEARRAVGNIVMKAKSSMEQSLQFMHSLMTAKDSFENPVGILKYETLVPVMKEEQRTLLRNGESLQRWLLEPESPEYALPKRGSKVKRNVADVRYDRDGGDLEAGIDGGPHSEAMEMGAEMLEFDDETNELEHQLFDEDDIFDLQPPPQSLTNNFHEITVEEIATKIKFYIERLQELENAGQESEILDFMEYFYELETLKQEIEFLARRHEILTEQLTNPNYTDEKLRRILTKDIRHLRFSERWVLYWSWVKTLRENVILDLGIAEKNYRRLSSEYENAKQLQDLYVVKQVDVVGMTTTCAARMHTLLSALKASIVIVEEAAEVLESHIVTSLTNSCQQVILIGDHKQLKPSAAVYKLSKDFNIDVSLFERMINNGMDCPMLNVQHRMRPEIASLITPLIYKDLHNDQSVFTYEDIEGMAKNLFFLEHNNYEEDVEESTSRKNIFEAEFLIELCLYLVLQGYDPEKITMLTTYTGQMFFLREKKRHRNLIQHVKCIVVDKYQGEENDIILLSLVRSNAEAKIGFLKTENRVCVALSRARKGLYIVGNMDNLVKSSPKLWGKIAERLREHNAIDKEMRLYCSRHDIYNSVSCCEDFDKVREGGCSKVCCELLKCGHNCRQLCHALDREHLLTRCRENCERKCARERHTCKKLCFERCGECMEGIEWTLPCDHLKTLPCHVDREKFLCDTIVDDVSPHCGHDIKRQCHEKRENVPCPHPCEDRVECGHACRLNCHKTVDPDHVEYKCNKPCERSNKLCSRAHKCKKLCFEDCGLCTIKVVFNLSCGHKKKLNCSTNIEEFDCHEDCEQICPICQQKCRRECYENCAPCFNMVEKEIPDCGHRAKIACYVPPVREHCFKPCERLLECGHKCAAKCGEPCGSVPCEELVRVNGVNALCGHNFVVVPCSRKAGPFNPEELPNLLANCNAPCDTLLKCGDPCAGTCGKCWQGRLHEPCQRDCGNINICGHRCQQPCNQTCPPCQEQCSYRCEHSKCPKKCGLPCTSCNEPCSWRCEHLKCTKKCGQICDREPCFKACPVVLECGHPCIGFCGEPCPPQCRECNKDITEIMFGYEDEEDARFVFLVDCEHTIASKAMDAHLNTTPEEGRIELKGCPLCKKPITRTLRYLNHIKKTYSDLQKEKSRIFGDEKTLIEKRRALQGNLVQFCTSSLQNIRATGLEEMRQMCNEYLKKVDLSKNKRNIVSMGELNLIDLLYKTFVDINSRLNNLCVAGDKSTPKRLHEDVSAKEVIDYLKALLGRICKPAVQMNEQLAEDLTFELRRYHKMVDYSLVLRSPLNPIRMSDGTVKERAEKLRELIFGVQRFDRIEQEVQKAFEDLQKILMDTEGRDVSGQLAEAVQNLIKLIHAFGSTEAEKKCADLGVLDLVRSSLGVYNERQTQYSKIEKYYKELNARLRPLSPEEERFKTLEKCLRNTNNGGRKLEIVQIFEVERFGENDRFERFKNFKNRKLLWHGSGVVNFSKILSQGLRITPAGAQFSGSLYGRGIYFADMVAKAANYCRPNSVTSYNMGLLLLCEVALGNIEEVRSSGALGVNYNSRKAVGYTQPDPKMNTMLEEGLEIALGPGVTVPSASGGVYNEYIVFNEAQVKIRYLIQVIL